MAKNKTKKISALFLVVILVILTACGNQTQTAEKAPLSENLPEDVAKVWADTVKAANEEGTLNLVAHTDSQFQAIAESFQKVFPNIKVKLTSMKPQEFAPRIVSEQQNGIFTFDVVFGQISNVTSTMIPNDALTELPPNLILPDVTDDSKWNGGFGLYTTEKPYALVYSEGASGVYVNREFITKEQVSSIKDFLKPELKGKIVSYDLNKFAGGSAALAAFSKREGEDYLKQLLAQDIVNATDPRQLVQWLIQGKYPIALFTQSTQMQKFKEEGLTGNIEKIDDSILIDYGVGIIKNPPNSNAAKVFVNWFLSKEGQEAMLNASPSNNSRRSDLPIQNKETYPDYNNIEKYVNMSDPKQQPQIEKAMKLYQEYINSK